MQLKNETERAARLFAAAMQKRGWSAHTVRAYDRGMMFFLRWLVAETKIESLNDVTSETIAAWREELGGWKISTATRELRFAAVKSFFRLMSEEGVIDRDVAEEVPFPQRVNDDRIADRPILTHDEAKSAVDAIKDRSPIGLRDRAILELLIVTGIRNSELRSLSLADVDFEDGSLLVRCGKGSKMRIVPLGRAATSLAQYIARSRPHLLAGAETDALFLSREHGPLSREALVRIVRTRTGVAPHRLRHSCATQMLRRGASSEKVQALLGHSSFETTRTYLH